MAEPAPAFTHTAAADWINSPPLILESLRGEVVLLDFWTFARWNCYRSFPWDSSFEQNCPSPCAVSRAQIEAFMALIPEIRMGDTQTYDFRGDRVQVFGNGKLLGSIEGAEFTRLLLSTWIGVQPPTAVLKRALLNIE